MTRPLRVFRRARKDMARIVSWLERRSVTGAESWRLALVHAIELIELNAEGYPTIAEAGPRWRRSIRQSLFKTKHGKKNYRIIFEFTPGEIRVLRVRGPGQRPLRPRDIPIQD